MRHWKGWTVAAFRKVIWSFLVKFGIHMSYDPAVLLRAEKLFLQPRGGHAGELGDSAAYGEEPRQGQVHLRG